MLPAAIAIAATAIGLVPGAGPASAHSAPFTAPPSRCSASFDPGFVRYVPPAAGANGVDLRWTPLAFDADGRLRPRSVERPGDLAHCFQKVPLSDSQ
jgi:hypothetical protein